MSIKVSHSPAMSLFVQKLIQCNNKETIQIYMTYIIYICLHSWDAAE